MTASPDAEEDSVPETLPETLEELLAQSRIRDLHVRYCRAADRLDADLFRSCFHDDAQFEFPVYSGGIDGFLAMAWETLARFETTRHFIGNQLVEVRGKRAWAEHYTVARHRIAADENGPLRDYVAHVRYIDELEHRGEWRIARRLLLNDLSLTEPVPGPAPRGSDGRRDRSDRSYDVASAFFSKFQGDS